MNKNWYSDLPHGPWKIADSIDESETKGYIHIAGINGEKICDIFPFAGRNGVGVKTARKIAEIIVKAREELP